MWIYCHFSRAHSLHMEIDTEVFLWVIYNLDFFGGCQCGVQKHFVVLLCIFSYFCLFLSIFVDLSSLFWGSLHMKINAGVLPCVIFNVEYFLGVSVCGVKKYFVVLLCIFSYFCYFCLFIITFFGLTTHENQCRSVALGDI